MNSRKTPYTFFFDLDGTITAEEILPKIAKEAGLSEQISELTKMTIAGEIPFVESFKKRVNMLRHIEIEKIKGVIEDVELNNELIQFIRENSESCFIVTGNLDVWVDELCRKIGCRFFTSKAKVSGDGRYIESISFVLDKSQIAKGFSSPLVAVGEGHNDAEMIKSSDIGIAYGGVHMPAASVLDCATHAIFEEKCLCGFLRQLL